MGADSRLSRADLDEIERRARRFSDRQWRRADTGGVERYALADEEGGEVAHLYARRELGDALTRAVADAARLLAALREERAEAERLRDEVERLGREARRSLAAVPAPAARARTEDVDEEAFVPLAAPFRVSPKSAKQAQTDPLIALAVQVAKALQDDAKEIERARLIAMALAATNGDMEAFWSARKQRATKRKK